MSWANCGEDSRGRPIGYAHAGKCDHPGCNKKINRGLSYACGDMHGETEFGCEKYFCDEHRSNCVEDSDGRIVRVCGECRDVLLNTDEWIDEDGVLVPVNE